MLKNLKVIYVDPKGYASIIETDIRLGIPKVQFPTPSTLPDLMNMIVVADKGIICKAGGNETTTISGSIYSGILKNITDNTILEKNPRTSIWSSPGQIWIFKAVIKLSAQVRFIRIRMQRLPVRQE